jgi:hypothetical protein
MYAGMSVQLMKESKRKLSLQPDLCLRACEHIHMYASIHHMYSRVFMHFKHMYMCIHICMCVHIHLVCVVYADAGAHVSTVASIVCA